MNRLLFFIIFLLLSFTSFSQNADFISVKKKNGVAVKSFYSGSFISLERNDGVFVSGTIRNIADDSLFILWYDIRISPTAWGNRVADTIAAYITKVKYTDIKRISLNIRRSRLPGLISKTFIIGGAGTILLNGFNSVRDKEPLFSNENLSKYAVAGAFIGVGYLIKRLLGDGDFNPKKHKIVYTKLDTN